MRKFIVILLPLLVLPLLGARRRAVARPAPPTFSKEVVRIFQAQCQSCHHPGDIAPFSLMSYREAMPWADSIKFMTQTHQMPPWKPARSCGEFVGERKLTQSQIDTLAAWVDGGALEGNKDDLPLALAFDGGWPLGAPDVVLKMPKPFLPPADQDEYRCFSIPVTSATALNISTIDFKPGDRGTVHHIIPFLDPSGASAALDKDGSGFQCFGAASINDAEPLGGWSPGSRPVPLPEGTALRIPGGSRVVMQVHYHPHFGRVAPDQTEIGLYLSKVPVRRELHYDILANTRLVIPAGAPDHLVNASFTVGNPIRVASVYPHMHLLGRSMKVDALLPDGTVACMVNITDYDFNWQGAYVFREPILLPAGSRIRIEARYDNSTSNLRNPTIPPKEVRWGEASTDEMCVAMIGYTLETSR
jgi:hypothetical protein